MCIAFCFVFSSKCSFIPIPHASKKVIHPVAYILCTSHPSSTGYALKEITVDPMVSRTKQMDEEIEIRKHCCVFMDEEIGIKKTLMRAHG